MIHREQAGGHVADEHRDHERRKPARAALVQNFDLGGGGFQSADAGADDDADFVAIQLVEFRAGILERRPRGMDAELRVAVRAPDILRRRKCRGRGQNSAPRPQSACQTPPRRTR